MELLLINLLIFLILTSNNFSILSNSSKDTFSKSISHSSIIFLAITKSFLVILDKLLVIIFLNFLI